MKKILIIEDDPAVVEGLTEHLKLEHFQVVSSNSGEKGYISVKKENPDLIILDLILPDMDGIDVCKKLRNEGIHIPIIMLTGRKDEIDRIIGLETGADDYVTKPFNIRELILRIKAILQRIDAYHSDNAKNYKFANIEVDFKKMEIRKNSKSITLPVMELKILKYFIERKGEVVTRDNLLNDVWGYDSFPTTRTVDNYILSLRKKIEEDPTEPKHLLTVYKAGYKFLE